MDEEIDAATARTVQETAGRHRVVMTWTVTWGTADHGEKFVARPQVCSAAGVQHLALHLKADTLESLRAALPPGLTRTEPHPSDDPAIVEVWL